MRDVNIPLRQAYRLALTGITNVPAYYMSAPNNVKPQDYIVYRSIQSNDVSTKNSSDTRTNITVEIHTYTEGINAGRRCDEIADEVYTRIYAIPQSVLALTGMQMVCTRLANDVSNNTSLSGNRNYNDRFLTFSHDIYVDGNFGSGTIIILDNNTARYEYTATGGEVSVIDSVLSGKVILDVNKDGLGRSKILNSGSPVAKQVMYNSGAGSITFPQPFEPNEEIFIIYKNS